MAANTTDILTNTRFIFGNQITSTGNVVTQKAGINTTPFAFEQAGYMAQEGFQNELYRLSQQLVTSSQATIIGQDVHTDKTGKILSVDPVVKNVSTNGLAGMTELNLYTNLLTSQSTLVQGIVQKQLDLQNRILSTLAS